MSSIFASPLEGGSVLPVTEQVGIEEVLPQEEQIPFRDQFKVDTFLFNRNDDLSLEAGRLHARIYQADGNGYINSEDIDELGLIKADVDTYADISEYFYTKEDEVSVVARQIPTSKKKGIESLPTLKDFSCDAEVLAKVAGVGHVSEIKPSEVVEISGLAAEGENTHWSVVRLYSEMMRSSMEKGHKLWVMSTDERLTPLLEYMLQGNLKELGESKHYMGSMTDPRCMNPQEVLNTYLDMSEDQLESDEFIAKTRDIFLSSLEGMNVDKLSEETITKLINNGIDVEKSSKVLRLIKRNKVAVTIGASLTAYAAARAVPLASIDEFNGSPAIFAALDIGTVPTYMAGLSMLYGRAKSNMRKAAGGLLASASFIAPYAYMYAEGEDYPGYVNGIVGALVISGIAKEVRSRQKSRKLEETLATDFEN